MKELSLEEKAKAYDEAIAQAKKLLKTIGNATLGNLVLKNEFEIMFPQLKDNENERIRKELIKIVNDHYSLFKEIDRAKTIAWLEKQGEQKPAVIIPKFKIGDVMRTIQEATDGIKDGLPVVVSIDDEYYRCNNEIIPIAAQENYEYPSMNRKQNSSWSEEDKKKINRIYMLLAEAADEHAFSTTCRLIGDKECVELQDFLKSLRPQNTWKPSNEQMKILNEVLNFAANHESPHWNDYIFGTLNNLIRQLKKLREE